MRSSVNSFGKPGETDSGQTKDQKRDSGLGSGKPQGKLFVIGLGPGGADFFTGQAKKALKEADVILGYKTYVALAKDFIEGKEVVSSGMTKELDRACQAIDLAMQGKKVALISSGDPGVYGMSPVVFEACKAQNLGFGKGGLNLEIVPGMPALAACAACLGAPLSHDFAVISLSDRMTDWELIKKRLKLVVEADMVVVLYNPKSKGRPWQLGEALDIAQEKRGPQGLVGIVGKATRQGESVSITTLDKAKEAFVDMQTLVIIGNSNTFKHKNKMVTPRGYVNKYGSQKAGAKESQDA